MDTNVSVQSAVECNYCKRLIPATTGFYYIVNAEIAEHRYTSEIALLEPVNKAVFCGIECLLHAIERTTNCR